MHTLGYVGMNIFEYPFHANQIWIATRFMEAVSLGVAFMFFHMRRRMNPWMVLLLFGIVTEIILGTVFIWKVFPVCFVASPEFTGQTQFKIVMEYVIVVILLIDILSLFRHRQQFDRQIFRWLMYSFLFTIGSELAFTFYVHNYGFSNMVGHMFKVFSFYLVYKAIIETGVSKPYQLIFRKLAQREKELEELNFTKDRFFSIIAHDLMNSISGLKHLSAILSDDISKMDSPPLICENVHLIEQTSSQTFRLLKNLLQWARSQSGKLERDVKQLMLQEVLQEMTDEFAERIRSKEIVFRIEQPDSAMVSCDMNLLQTALRNLLSNAVKFTPRGGNITIRASRKNGNYQIEVEDTGVGISEEILPRLFDPDRKYNKKGTDGEHGNGLGLMLTRELVEKNGGEISVRSVTGQGTTFIFTIPSAD